MAYDITITADEATKRQWLEAIAVLRRPYRIPILARMPVPGVPSRLRSLTVTGERLLLEVGQACSRVDNANDPARFFGLFRYATALSGAHPNLTIGAAYHTLDTHKKKVLSDELGCGMAFIIARQLFGATVFLDFETAILQRVIRTTAPRSRRPDYLAFTRPGRAILLEAKGTQTGHSYCEERQIPKGCDQVRRPRLSAPTALTIDHRIVVATSLTFDDWGSDTAIYLGDPDQDEPEDYRFSSVPDLEAGRLHYLRVAELIGDFSLAAALRGRIGRPQAEATAAVPMVRRHIDGVPFDGSQITLVARDTTVGVFVGLAASVREEVSHEHKFADNKGLHGGLGAGLDIGDQHEPRPVSREALLEPSESIALAGDGTALITSVERR